MVDQRLSLGVPTCRVRLQAVDFVLQLGELTVGLAQPAQLRFFFGEPFRGELLQRLQLAEEPLLFAHALLRARRRKTFILLKSPWRGAGSGVTAGAIAPEAVSCCHCCCQPARSWLMAASLAIQLCSSDWRRACN